VKFRTSSFHEFAERLRNEKLSESGLALEKLDIRGTVTIEEGNMAGTYSRSCMDGLFSDYVGDGSEWTEWDEAERHGDREQPLMQIDAMKYVRRVGDFIFRGGEWPEEPTPTDTFVAPTFVAPDEMDIGFGVGIDGEEI